MSGVARVHSVVLECQDPVALATFYAELTGWALVEQDPDWATIRERPDQGSRLAFQRAPGHAAPAWPDPASPMQFHLDFMVDDPVAAEEVALNLGATKFAHQPGQNFTVYADPAGHPFCLCH